MREHAASLHEDAFEIRSAGREARVRRFSGAMVSGAYSKYFVIDSRAHASLLGVHFKRGVARSILGVPPGSLADEHAELAVLGGADARELRERLGSAVSVQQRFEILQAALLHRLSTSAMMRRAAPEESKF